MPHQSPAAGVASDDSNTTGFDETGFDQTGAVKGFGWSSILVVAVGAQYEVAEGFPIRVVTLDLFIAVVKSVMVPTFLVLSFMIKQYAISQ